MRWLVWALLSVLLVGCSSTPANPGHYNGGDGTSESDIKRSLQIEMEVMALKDAVQSVQTWVDDAGGFIQSQQYPTYGGARIVCRIPTQQRSQFNNQVKSLGELQDESMQAEDLSDEITNLDMELKNLYQLRNRLTQLLDKAAKVDDILSIERELNRVQARIDYLEKTEREQAKSVQYVSYTLTLNEKEKDRILGPVGYLVYGVYWVVEKLFVIR